MRRDWEVREARAVELNQILARRKNQSLEHTVMGRL